MNKILESFVDVAPYINMLTSSDFAVSVCDLKKCLCYIPGKNINHNLRKGSLHNENAATYKCIKQKKRIVTRVEKKVFGFPYIVIAVPLFDEYGNVIGAVSFSEIVDKQEMLVNTADSLHSGMQQMISSADIITDNADNLKESGRLLQVFTNNFNESVVKTDEVLNIISNLANQTNLLGLNTAIEAVRVGELGRGFSIVAEEMRRLAKNTEVNVKKINSVLSEFKDATDKMKGRIEEINACTSTQVDCIRDIYDFIHDINKISEQLKKQARLLSEDVDN